MPQAKLFQYLKDIGDGSIAKETPDCSVTEFKVPANKKYSDLADSRLISTTDFFYPLVDDPYMQGRIACCNVLSDLYAMGVPRVDHMLMILGVSLEMDENAREIITKEMMRGFNDCATEAETIITGGQSIMNPWPMIGGVANVMVLKDEYVKPNLGEPGDLILLTKPLGTQPAVNLMQKLQKDQNWTPKEITHLEIQNAYYLAMESMATLNKNSSTLLKRYKSHGATDITGFGIKGHAQNLAGAQFGEVDLVIDALPIIGGMERKVTGMHDFKLTEGFSAETSGGILTMMAPNQAREFIKASLTEFGQTVWIVGQVFKGTRKAQIRSDVSIIEVKDSPFKH